MNLNEQQKKARIVQKIMEKVIDYAKQKGIEQCDVISTRGRSLSLSVQKGELEQTKISQSQKMGIRIIHQGKVGISYSESWEEKSLQEMVEEAKLLASYSDVDPYQRIEEKNALETWDIHSLCELENDGLGHGQGPSMEERIQLAMLLESEVLKRDTRVQSAPYNGVSEGEGEKFYLNHLGTFGYLKDRSFSCYTSALASEKGKNALFSGQSMGRLFKDLDLEFCVNESLKHALSLLSSQSIPSGAYDVIMTPNALNSLLGCFLNFFSAKSAMEGKNPFKDKLGNKVASSSLSIEDVPFHPQGFFFSSFDDEGIKRKNLSLIEEGELKNFYHNSVTARYFKTYSTGHGARSPQSSLGIAPTQWLIHPGPMEEKDLRSGKYLEIIQFEGLHAGTNAITGHFSLGAKGYLYEKGQLSQSISGITLSGQIGDLLQSVVGVGNLLHWTPDRSLFTPVIRFANLQVAGS